MTAKEVLQEKLDFLKKQKASVELEAEQLRLEVSSNQAHLVTIDVSIKDIERTLRFIG